jgi:arginase family enzyme
MSPSLGLIGVPTSAGAFAPGQEQAPQALRDAAAVAGSIAGALAIKRNGQTRSVSRTD